MGGAHADWSVVWKEQNNSIFFLTLFLSEVHSMMETTVLGLIVHQKRYLTANRVRELVENVDPVSSPPLFGSPPTYTMSVCLRLYVY